jgi:hypothetical protein
MTTRGLFRRADASERKYSAIVGAGSPAAAPKAGFRQPDAIVPGRQRPVKLEPADSFHVRQREYPLGVRGTFEADVPWVQHRPRLQPDRKRKVARNSGMSGSNGA